MDILRKAANLIKASLSETFQVRAKDTVTESLKDRQKNAQTLYNIAKPQIDDLNLLLKQTGSDNRVGLILHTHDKTILSLVKTDVYGNNETQPYLQAEATGAATFTLTKSCLPFTNTRNASRYNSLRYTRAISPHVSPACLIDLINSAITDHMLSATERDQFDTNPIQPQQHPASTPSSPDAA